MAQNFNKLVKQQKVGQEIYNGDTTSDIETTECFMDFVMELWSSELGSLLHRGRGLCPDLEAKQSKPDAIPGGLNAEPFWVVFPPLAQSRNTWMEAGSCQV